MEHGVIKKIIDGKGFGFITCDNGAKDLFFHARGCIGEFLELQETDAVSFVRKTGDKGDFAADVRRVG